jgi:3-isopropylmalate/(R)-2-methylmalate dehydratase small subunit
MSNLGVPGFSIHTGRIAVVPDDNIDTDRIIPARFLTRVSRSGYGELLFCDVRGPCFPLDMPDAKGASVLVVGTNFGCGSSREHAVWAIQQAGFVSVIARRTATSPGYSDIFRQNAANCALLLIELENEAHEKLVNAGSGATVTVDLAKQEVRIGPETLAFEINAGTKAAILEGLDLVGATLRHEAEISAFETRDKLFAPPREATVL